MRRKKKVVVREHGNDEKKIQSVLKKIGLSEIPSIDEVGCVLWKCQKMKSTVNNADVCLVWCMASCHLISCPV